MSKQIDALKLVLEALEMYCEHGAILKPIEMRDAIKEALAQEKALQALHDENERLGLYKDAYAGPEQEPDLGGVDVFYPQRSDEIGTGCECPNCANGMGMCHTEEVQPEQGPAIFLKEWSDWRDMVVVNIMRHGSIDKHLARELANHFQSMTPQPKEQEQEPLEYWNAVEGWVKIDEVREHFDSVGCATIYKTAGEGRVPLSLCKAQPEQREPTKQEHNILMGALKRSAKVVAQPEQNLNCKSTQARLATAWGYVKAQPEQEPVGYFNANSDGKWEQSDSNDGVPFYAALPPQPKEPEQEHVISRDAYDGAREDLAIWKKRALEAEELNRKFIAEINGPTHMGEPVRPEQKPVTPFGLPLFWDAPLINEVTKKPEPVACTDVMCACRGGPCVSCPDGEHEKAQLEKNPVLGMKHSVMYSNYKD